MRDPLQKVVYWIGVCGVYLRISRWISVLAYNQKYIVNKIIIDYLHIEISDHEKFATKVEYIGVWITNTNIFMDFSYNI